MNDHTCQSCIGGQAQAMSLYCECCILMFRDLNEEGIAFRENVIYVDFKRKLAKRQVS